MPTIRGSRCVPPSISGTPQRRSGKPRREPGCAIRRSHHSASSSPPARHQPCIAAIDGHCLAGGLELALWCDLRVATPASTFGCSERRWGVPLIDGGTQRLPRAIGMARALDLILTGRTIAAAEALEIGLLTRVADDALAAAIALAEEIAAFPQDTVRSDRQAALEGFGLPLSEGLALEAELGRERIVTAIDGAKRFRDRPRQDP